jgi:hypothetical protein
MKKNIFVLCLTIICLGLAQNAFAYTLVLDNWQIDPSVVSGSLPGPVGDIYEISFAGLTFTDNHAATVGPGVTFDDYGALRATDLLTYELDEITGSGLGTDYQLTAVFVGSGINTTRTATNQDFVFYPGGTLDIYLDTTFNFAETNLESPGTIIRYGADDGTKVASLELLVGAGNLDFASPTGKPDGALDIVYKFTYALPDFWLDENGNDLADLIPTTNFLVGLTDSNNEIFAPTNAQIAEFTESWGNGMPTFDTNNLPVDLYTRNDGSMKLGVVPEPTSMLLLGMGALGLVPVVRRKKVA